MDWRFSAFMGAILIGSYNTFMEATKVFFPGGTVNQLLLMMALQVVTGVIGILGLFALRYTHKREYNIMFTNHLHFPYTLLVIPAIIQIGYLLFNLKALSEGGSVAMAIINMNTFVTIILGTLILKDKINVKTASALALSVFAGIYAVYEQQKLK